MKKTNYAYLAILTILVMIAIQLCSSFLAVDSEPNTAANWHFIAIFVNAIILGSVFFKHRALWEINHGLGVKGFLYSKRKPLTSYLLKTSWLIVFILFVSFLLSFRHFFQVWLTPIPEEFRHLFQWPALISGFILMILTIGGWIIRDMEDGEIPILQ